MFVLPASFFVRQFNFRQFAVVVMTLIPNWNSMVINFWHDVRMWWKTDNYQSCPRISSVATSFMFFYDNFFLPEYQFGSVEISRQSVHTSSRPTTNWATFVWWCRQANAWILDLLICNLQRNYLKTKSTNTPQISAMLCRRVGAVQQR
jgi:hypothetical protein